MSKKLSLIIMILVSIVVVILLNHFELQFFLTIFLISTLFIVTSIAIKNAFLQYFFIILFTVGLTGSGIELYSYYKLNDDSIPKFIHEGSVTKGFYKDDEYLGYAPMPNMTVQSTKKMQIKGETQLVFDAQYTTDNYAHRITPSNPDANIAIVLFGCSFTFGDGINDNETYPYKLANLLGEKYQVYNFGFSGYGPHQMLANLEKEIPYLKKYDKVIAYYLALDSHNLRAAGITTWNRTGPRYLFKNNEVVRDGTFDDNFLKIDQTIFGKLLRKSITYKMNKRNLTNFSPFDTDEKVNEIFCAIISESSKKFLSTYPNSTFSILAWPDALHNLSGLPEQIPVIDMEPWFPQGEKFKKYIIANDGHPNDAATTIMAENLAKIIQLHDDTLVND